MYRPVAVLIAEFRKISQAQGFAAPTPDCTKIGRTSCSVFFQPCRENVAKPHLRSIFQSGYKLRQHHHKKQDTLQHHREQCYRYWAWVTTGSAEAIASLTAPAEPSQVLG